MQNNGKINEDLQGFTIDQFRGLYELFIKAIFNVGKYSMKN